MTNPVIARSLRFTRTCSADRSYEGVGTGYSLGRAEQLRSVPLATRGRSPVSDDPGITGKSGRSLPMLHVSSGVFLRSSRYSTTPTENAYITSLRRNQWTTAEYYDLVLGLIPLAFVGATGALILSGIGLTTAVPLGALVSLGLLIHGLFINGPVDTPASPTSADGNTDRSFEPAD
jgi:hypothetical protein